MANLTDDTAAHIKSGKYSGWMWLFKFIRRTFARYYRDAPKASVDSDIESASNLLRIRIARQSAALAIIIGLLTSIDFILTLILARQVHIGSTAGVTLFIAGLIIEPVLLLRLELLFLARLARLHGGPIDSDSTGDLLAVMSIAAGGEPAPDLKGVGFNMGTMLSGKTTSAYIQREAAAALPRIARRAGFRLLRRSVMKYSVPVASLAIGAIGNYRSVNKSARVGREWIHAKVEHPDAVEAAASVEDPQKARAQSKRTAPVV